MNFGKSRILTLVMFLLFACAVTYAQQNSVITGEVTDSAGAAVSDADVTVTSTATGFVSSTKTNSAGLFSIPGLNVGTYELKVSMKGFQTFVAKGLELNVSQTLRHDVGLSVGSVSETVTVEANGLAVQTDSNVISTLISSEQIAKIATQNRNFAALAALGLGVSSALPDNNTPTSVAANFTISVNGLRQSHNIWLIDGGEADDRGGAGGMSIMPSQDAISQFEMLSSNYPPDYGISSGATISLSLKSGTRNFHGSLWEFNRNTVYNANNYFNNQSNSPRQKLNYNIFGFNVGGPVMIPGLYNTSRQKTFFFWNEEWRKIIQGSSPAVKNTLPAADFPTAGQSLKYVAPGYASTSKILVPNAVSDPAYLAKLASLGLTPGSPFPNNVIPAALIDPNAVAYLGSGVIPKPNLANDQIVSQANQPIDVRDDIIRIDHRITDKWQILGHYMHDSVTQAYAQPMLGWSGADYNTITSTLSNPSNSATIKLTGSITPNLLAEVSMNYDGNVINITNSANSQLPSGVKINRFFNNGSTNTPNMHFSTPYNTQENPGSAPWHNAAQDYYPKLDVSYLAGKHAMKFGLGYNRYTKNQQLFGNPGGDISFGTLTGGTYVDPVTHLSTTYSGDSMVDMMLGLASKYQQAQALPIRHYVNQTTSVYAMDNWHVTPRLSLQLGLRYDALPFATERGNNVSNFDPTQYLSSLAPAYILDSKGNPTSQLDPTGPGFATVNGQRFYLNGIYIAGQNGHPRGLVNNDYGTLQPRVGFSEDLFGTGKTILRGGFGSFYERLQGNNIYDAATTVPFFNYPSASAVYLTNPSTSYVTGATAAQPFFAQSATTLALHYPAPGVTQFSLGVQHQIAPSVLAVVQYVGNLAWHQNIRRNINTYPLNTALSIRANSGDASNNSGSNPGGHSLANADLYRTYQGWGGINQQENTTNGNYNGFQTGVRVQNRWGFTGEVNYTWSHEIDLTSYDDNGISNPFNLKYDKGSGALDRRHIFNANYIYQLPIFTKSSTLLHSILGGWELAGTMVWETGTIIANQGPGLSISYDPVGLGGGYTNRPNINGKMHYTKTQQKWFDPSVFSAPTPAWAGNLNQGFGNAGKDSIVGPGRVNFNTSLYKTFAFTERVHFEFRAESFNTFNHTQFNGVGNSFGNGNFGQVTSTWDPRTLQLGGKLSF
jgi:carboxypeptidase family protein